MEQLRGQLDETTKRERDIRTQCKTILQVYRYIAFVTCKVYFSKEGKRRKTLFNEDGRRNISNTRDSVSSEYPNIEKAVENTTHSGVFLTKFDVFG